VRWPRGSNGFPSVAKLIRRRACGAVSRIGEVRCRPDSQDNPFPPATKWHEVNDWIRYLIPLLGMVTGLQFISSIERVRGTDEGQRRCLEGELRSSLCARFGELSQNGLQGTAQWYGFE
jgi:hypothetical protein